MGDRAPSSNNLRRGQRRSKTFAPAFAEQSANRLGRAEVKLIFTLTKVVIALNLHEQRFEASMREEFELVCVVLPQGATRGIYFFKNEARKMEARKSNTPINSSTVKCMKTFPDPGNGNDLKATRVYEFP